MDNSEFSQIRRSLGKTQGELARLLCVSPKAIQSFEQGWRNIPASAERQLLFLISLKRYLDKNTSHLY
ncbi:helix-turn-helix domain-containing protein [Chloroflexota bacterium]